MKIAEAIITRFIRTQHVEADAFDRRLSKLGTQQMLRRRTTLPSLFIRHIAA